MKVLFNVYPIAFDCPGGGEIQLLKTREALQALGAEVRLYDQWNPQLGWPQVVHYFSVFGGSEVFCNYIKAKGLPLVISPILWPRGDTSGYPMDLIHYLLHRADLLFPNSKLEAEALADVFSVPIEKFHITYNGVDEIFLIEQQPDPSLFRNAFQIEGPFALCVGNIETRKNQIRLAEAAAALKLKTLLFGNIRDQNYFEDVMRLGKGYVEYRGYLPHHDPLLRSAYQACDVFVLPSTLETPGLAALEAAALGANIVVTQEGSTREYFGDDVVYVDPFSTESIRLALESALQNQADPDRRESLKKRIQGSFTWRHTAQACLSGYRKLTI